MTVDGDAILAENFAPWVKDLGLRVEEMGADFATLRLPNRYALMPPRALEHQRWLIKRAGAVPGEPVPPEVRRAVEGSGARVPSDHLVVLGDNAAVSVDSRTYGYISGERLLGVVARPIRKARGSGRP